MEFFIRRLRLGPVPTEVTTDRAPVYPSLIDEHTPAALHVTEQYANNIIEADHGRLKARLRPMRGLKRLRSARIVAAGHAVVQNCAAATTTSSPMSPSSTVYAWPSPSSHPASNPTARPRHRLDTDSVGSTQHTPASW